MKKIFNLLFYYFLILLGLFATSWIIYARFIRERTIRDIPDSLLTELRFWILIYMCCIYLYTIKSIQQPGEGNAILKVLSNLIYKPLVTLDQSIKYHPQIKPYFIKFIVYFITLFGKLPIIKGLYTIIFMLQIFPRIILVTILVIDTFYFHRIENFYKFVLIGLLPFMSRYIKYTLKDFSEHMVTELENKYAFISVYEKGFEPWKEALRKKNKNFFEDDWDDNRKLIPTALYHKTSKSIKEFIEIDFNNQYNEITAYNYNAIPFCKDEVYQQYVANKYKPKSIPPFVFSEYELLDLSDKKNLNKLFHDYMPIIIQEKLIFLQLDLLEQYKTIKLTKTVIFLFYFLCWSFILLISYLHFPIDLVMSKYYLTNFFMYLINQDNPFSELFWGSLNAPQITVDYIEALMTKFKDTYS